MAPHLTSHAHHLTINVTGILTGCTPALELVAVTVSVKVPAGVPCGCGGGGGGGVEPPPPQPTKSSTANAPVAKTQRGMCLLVLSRYASKAVTSRQIAHSGQTRTLNMAGGSHRRGPGASWLRTVVIKVIIAEVAGSRVRAENCRSFCRQSSNTERQIIGEARIPRDVYGVTRAGARGDDLRRRGGSSG